MAKKSKKSKKFNINNVILSAICIIFGLLMFCSMFMPIIKLNNEDETPVSACNVATAMTFADATEDPIQSAKDIANASESEVMAYSMINIDEYKATTMAAAILNIIASCLGLLLALSVAISIFVKGNKMIRLTLLILAVAATLFALGAMISNIILMGIEMGGIAVRENASISAATILAFICGIVSTSCVCLKK